MRNLPEQYYCCCSVSVWVEHRHSCLPINSVDKTAQSATSSRFLSTAQVAAKYPISPHSLRRYLRENQIPGAYKDPQGQWRIPEYAVEEFLSESKPSENIVEQLLDYWELLKSRPSWRLGAILIGSLAVMATIIGLLVDIPELLNNSGEPSVVALPREIQRQLPDDISLSFWPVDLNGILPNEYVVSWAMQNHPPDKPFEDVIEVFGYDPIEGWNSLLRLHELSPLCGNIGPAYDGTVDLFGDHNRQIVLSTGCGTGLVLIYFEVFQYNELGLMERIYTSGDSDASGLSGIQSIRVINENLYVETFEGIHQCSWRNDTLACDEVIIDPGAHLVTVEYWVDEDDGVQLSQSSVSLEVGQYLDIKARSLDDLYRIDNRIYYTHDGVLKQRAGYYYAAKPGKDVINIGPFYEEASYQGTIDVLVIDPVDTPFSP